MSKVIAVLMGRDEVGTLRTLTAYRGIIDPLIASHRGRIFNTAGDSLVADFASAVDAVQCAVEVQDAIAKENAPRPANEQMRFRIGVHVGDIMVRATIFSAMGSISQPGWRLSRRRAGQRTKAGLERARAKGKVLGRPRFSDGDRDKLIAALDSAESWDAVSKATRIPCSTVKKHARTLGYKSRQVARRRAMPMVEG
jgi:hypothetical protein